MLAALLALAACEAPPPEPVTLRIGLLQTQDALPHFVMQEQGFDRKNGLRFEELYLPNGTALIERLSSGALELSPTVGVVPLLLAAERGLVPGRVVEVAANNVADREHRGVGVLGAHALSGWNDLDGKKLGVNAPMSLSAAALDIRLKQEGVKGYSFVVMPSPNMGLAVAGGNVAAAVMSEPHLTQALQRGDGRLLGWVIGGVPFERMEFSSIVVSAELRRTRPQAVKAYLRAHLAAVKWINDHPAEARLTLARHLKLTDEVGKNVNLLRWPLDARPDAAQVDRDQRILLEAGILKQAQDTRTIFDETLLAEVLKEKR